MPNHKYQRGSAFERKIKRLLEEAGYYVIKSAGSKGAADLQVTGSNAQTLWIQCKKDGRIDKTGFQKLENLGKHYSIPVLLVSKPKRNGKIEVEAILFGNTTFAMEVIYHLTS